MYPDKIQEAIKRWNEKNFPLGTPQDCLIGVMEELGELAHADLKGRQKIRGTTQEHINGAKDAIDDIAIFLMAYCGKRGFSFHQCIEDAWKEVEKRDWTKQK